MKVISTIFFSLIISCKLFASGCTPPVVTSQPSNVVVCENGNTFFQIVASGPSLIYQWQIDQGAGFVNLSNVAPFSGVTTDLLTITTVPFSLDNSVYRCIVTNGCVPDDTSAIAQLKVNVAPSIVTQPANAIVCDGATTTFSVITSGTGLSYQWQVDDGSGFVNVPSAPPYSGDTTGALYITGTTFSFNGYNFQCIVSGTCSPSVTSTSVSLSVDSLPVVTVQPTFVEMCEGTSDHIAIEATGTGITYQWQVNSGSGYTDLVDGASYMNVTTNDLYVISPTLSMNGYLYQCIVSGACSPADTSYEISLIVYPTYSIFTSATICQGDTFVFGGSNLTAPGFYSNTFSTINSCDSLVYLSLNVNPAYYTTLSNTICDGDSVSINGNYETMAGVYTFVLSSSAGCDSTIDYTLNVNPSYYFYDTTTICSGDSALIFGVYESADSLYINSNSTVLGCDSVYSHLLILQLNYLMSEDIHICDGDSVMIGASYESSPGVYTTMYSSVFGCDSTVNSTLYVHYPDSTSQSITICSNDSVFIGGAYQNTPGVYTDSLNSVFGCDSTVTTTLFVNTSPNVVFDAVATVCDTAAGFAITGGSPAGGYYYGPGVSAGYFWASAAGVGTHIISYVYTDSINGCSDTVSSTITVTACTGINDLVFNSDFNIYPNPFNEILIIESFNTETSEVLIFNVLGELMYSQKIQKGKTEIDMSEISSGVYFIQSRAGEKISTQKLIKK